MEENDNAAVSAENRILRLKKGDAYKIKVEKTKEMADSPFKSVYFEAMAAFQEIEKDNETKYRTEKDLELRNVDRLPEFNNVIAFCGERGSGKTSAMVSFRNLLDGWGNKDSRKEGIGPEFSRQVPSSSNCYFLCLDTVDPSRFEPHDRLIGSIVGELYRRFERMISSNHDSKKHDLQREVESAFRDVHEAVQLLSNSQAQPFGTPGAGENPFDILRRAGKAASMRELVHKLVKAFLDFAPSEKESIKYLVIPVDDLDMSVQHAYVLAEDIRKYFLIPNVVVLLAAKLDQLRMAVEQGYVERFEHYMKRLNKPDANEIESMSNLYLEKLVPLGRRLNMPDFSRVEITQETNLEWDEVNVGPLELYLIRILFKKTGIIYKQNDDQVHPIVPTTLRELHNFLEWIDRIEDNNFPIGLSKFKTYFLVEWIPRNLQRSEEALMGKMQAAPLQEKNWTIVQLLSHWLRINLDILSPEYDRIEQSQKWWSETFKRDWKEILRIVDRTRPKHEVSIGEVRFILKIIEKLSGKADGIKVVFAVKTLITLEMLAVFDSLIASGYTSKDQEFRLYGLLNGSMVHPLMYEMFDPTNFPTIMNATSLSNSKAVKRLTINGKLGKKRHEQVVERLGELCTEVCQSEERGRHVFGILSQMLYFGKVKDALAGRRDNSRWYDLSLPLYGEGKKPSFVSFDFWAFLFWVYLPTYAIGRIGDGKETGVSDERIDQFKKHVIKNGAFWRQILQIEALDAIAESMQLRFVSDQKNQKMRGKYLPSFFFGWTLRNFVYACKNLFEDTDSQFVTPPTVFDLFASEAKERILSDLEIDKLGLAVRSRRDLERLRESGEKEGFWNVNEILQKKATGKFVDSVALLENALPNEDLQLAKRALELFEKELRIRDITGILSDPKQQKKALAASKKSILDLRKKPSKGSDMMQEELKEFIETFQPIFPECNWDLLESALEEFNEALNDREKRDQVSEAAEEILTEIEGELDEAGDMRKEIPDETDLNTISHEDSRRADLIEQYLELEVVDEKVAETGSELSTMESTNPPDTKNGGSDQLNGGELDVK
jgi:hypothetical protein